MSRDHFRFFKSDSALRQIPSPNPARYQSPPSLIPFLPTLQPPHQIKKMTTLIRLSSPFKTPFPFPFPLSLPLTPLSLQSRRHISSSSSRASIRSLTTPRRRGYFTPTLSSSSRTILMLERGREVGPGRKREGEREGATRRGFSGSGRGMFCFVLRYVGGGGIERREIFVFVFGYKRRRKRKKPHQRGKEGARDIPPSQSIFPLPSPLKTPSLPFPSHPQLTPHPPP